VPIWPSGRRLLKLGRYQRDTKAGHSGGHARHPPTPRVAGLLKGATPLDCSHIGPIGLACEFGLIPRTPDGCRECSGRRSRTSGQARAADTPWPTMGLGNRSYSSAEAPGGQSQLGSMPAAGRGNPTLGWFDSIAAPSRGFLVHWSCVPTGSRSVSPGPHEDGFAAANQRSVIQFERRNLIAPG